MVRIAGGLVASKILALFVGPGGLALIGNFRNFLSSVDIMSTLGFQNGIIKYVAENEKNEDRLVKILATVFYTLLAVILFTSLLLGGLSFYWSNWIFNGDLAYTWVFIVLAILLPWYAGNIIIVSILNGLGRYKQVISVTIWGNITGVLLSALLIWKLGINGALIGLILSPASLFLFSGYLIRREFSGKNLFSKKNIDFSLLKGFFSYSLMSLVTAVFSPVVFVLIRNMIIDTVGKDEAGYYEAINRISSFYMMFISTLLTLYFLPKLSVADNNAETRKIFRSYYKGIIPPFFAGLLIIFILKKYIIQTLLSDEFLPMENLFFWQLLGDLFKACALVLGYEFFARKMTKTFMVTEALSFLLLYCTSYFLIPLYGSEGAVMSHTLIYALLLVSLAVYFRKKLF